MRRNFGQFRFSPRPRSIKRVRKFVSTASIAYIENGAGRLETRERGRGVRHRVPEQRSVHVHYTSAYEFLPQPFRIAPGVTLPVGGYDFASLRVGFNFGKQRPVAGNVSVEHGTFYNGHKTTVGVSRGRVNFTPQLSVEPTLSVNRVDLLEGRSRPRWSARASPTR